MSKIENLFNALREDKESIFYAADQLTKNLINKAKKSFYPKDKGFINLFKENKQQIEENKKRVVINKILLTTPFIPKKSNVEWSTLYSFKGPFEALQADIADIWFLAKSAVDPHYCLLVVDLFINMTYTYPMKRRKQLAAKIAQSYEDIKSERQQQLNI